MLAWIDAVALGRGPVDPDLQARPPVRSPITSSSS